MTFALDLKINHGITRLHMENCLRGLWGDYSGCFPLWRNDMCTDNRECTDVFEDQRRREERNEELNGKNTQRPVKVTKNLVKVVFNTGTLLKCTSMTSRKSEQS